MEDRYGPNRETWPQEARDEARQIEEQKKGLERRQEYRDQRLMEQGQRPLEPMK